MVQKNNMSEAFLKSWRKGLDYLIEGSRLKSREIAESVGTTPRHLSSIKTGHGKPSLDLMERLSEMVGYTSEQVAQIGRAVLEGRKPELRRASSAWDDFKIVPMVKAQPKGGTSSLITDDDLSRHYMFREDFLRRKGNPDMMVMFKVWGDSMAPLISDQDTILVDESQNHPQEGQIYIVGIDDDIIVKRIARQPKKLILRSESPEWEDIEISKENYTVDFRVYGKVLWVGKELA